MHAEAFAAGELKHGPIALIEDGLPVVVVMPSPKGARCCTQAAVNIQEIKARGARTVVLAETGDETVRPFADHLFELPAVPTLLQPLVATIPLQVIAAEIARARGYDVDKPRNLAKSVTVSERALRSTTAEPGRPGLASRPCTGSTPRTRYGRPRRP